LPVVSLQPVRNSRRQPANGHDHFAAQQNVEFPPLLIVPTRGGSPAWPDSQIVKLTIEKGEHVEGGKTLVKIREF
jgi:hypothetical protein